MKKTDKSTERRRLKNYTDEPIQNELNKFADVLENLEKLNLTDCEIKEGINKVLANWTNRNK